MDAATADLLGELYGSLPSPLFRVPVEIAELVKYADNVWHALKVAFGNEIGTLCKSLDIDSHALMEIFCSDTKLNISKAYLMPGFAFGGSCLPKDTRALAHFCVSRGRGRARHRQRAAEQQAADRARCRMDPRNGREEDRLPRLQLQGRNRRSARESVPRP